MDPEEKVVLEAIPKAQQVARTIAMRHGVRSSDMIEDCEQTACQALLEARPRYDASIGPFDAFAWKRAAGAVTRMLKKERSIPQRGLDDALDAAEVLCEGSDALDDDQCDPLAVLKGHCRWLAFKRFVGDTCERLAAQPDDRLVRARASEALRLALGEYSDEEQRLIELRYFQGLSWAKVAAAMGVHEKYASRLDEALRHRLKRDLRARGIDEEAAASAAPV